MDSKDYEVVIVGAGIAGASLAYRLAGRRRVLLLERESQPGYHSTGRSAAMFMETYGTDQIQALTRASKTFYEHPPEGFCDAPLMHPRGCLYIATAEQGELLDEALAAASARADNVRRLTPQEACDLVPVLRPEAAASGAMFEGDARDLDVHGLHQGFLAAARRGGVQLQCNAAVAQARYADEAWTLTLANGDTIRTRLLVNAAGAWADELAALCGVRPIGLQPCRRSAFTFAAPQGADIGSWPAVVGIDESFYFKPDAGQLLGSPANADPVAPHDVVAEELDVATGIYHIETATTMSIRRPAHVWAGLRSFVPDGDMVIGLDDAQPGFFWLAAQGGYGIQSAAGVSALAGALVLDEPLPDELVREGVDPIQLSPARLRTSA